MEVKISEKAKRNAYQAFRGNSTEEIEKYFSSLEGSSFTQEHATIVKALADNMTEDEFINGDVSEHMPATKVSTAVMSQLNGGIWPLILAVGIYGVFDKLDNGQLDLGGIYDTGKK